MAAKRADGLQPPKQQDYDLFGGCGLFGDLHAVGVALAAWGMLPVAFRPTRISFHPLRSTLAYSVMVTLVVGWASWRTVTMRLEVFHSQHRLSLHTRFTSVVSLGSLVGLLMLPLLWLEARHVRRHQTSCEHVMTLARCSVVCVALFVPVTVALWLSVIAWEGASWSHAFAHNHVLSVPVLLCSLVSGSAYCVKRFADVLRAALVQELSGPWLAARRVAALRHTWVHLRDATRLLVRTPLTAMFMTLYMVLMSTLAAYQALVSVMEGLPSLALLLTLLGSHYYVMLLMLCDAVHRAVQAVGKDILLPLEMFAGVSVPAAARAEVNLFREVVAACDIEVSAAGYWQLSRRTMTSILSTTISYVIILVQFRQPEYATGRFRNESDLATPAQPP